MPRDFFKGMDEVAGMACAEAVENLMQICKEVPRMRQQRQEQTFNFGQAVAWGLVYNEGRDTTAVVEATRQIMNGMQQDAVQGQHFEDGMLVSPSSAGVETVSKELDGPGGNFT